MFVVRTLHLLNECYEMTKDSQIEHLGFITEVVVIRREKGMDIK